MNAIDLATVEGALVRAVAIPYRLGIFGLCQNRVGLRRLPDLRFDVRDAVQADSDLPVLSEPGQAVACELQALGRQRFGLVAIVDAVNHPSLREPYAVLDGIDLTTYGFWPIGSTRTRWLEAFATNFETKTELDTEVHQAWLVWGNNDESKVELQLMSYVAPGDEFRLS